MNNFWIFLLNKKIFVSPLCKRFLFRVHINKKQKSQEIVSYFFSHQAFGIIPFHLLRTEARKRMPLIIELQVCHFVFVSILQQSYCFFRIYANRYLIFTQNFNQKIAILSVFRKKPLVCLINEYYVILLPLPATSCMH